jgi:AcrR family transcriptional regulator
MATSAYSPRSSNAGPFALDVDYSSAPILARLPRGRHGLPQEFVDRNHRNRLLAGAIESAAERGYPAMTITDITTHAAVSRGAFYRHFADKEECFLAAYDIAVGWLIETVGCALESSENWPQALATAVTATLDLFAADSRLARLCTVEVFLAGAAAVARHEALVEHLSAPLCGGRAESPLGAELAPQLEQALLGGAISLIARYVNAGRGEHLPELAPVLTELLLVPYLGAAAAQQLARVA